MTQSDLQKVKFDDAEVSIRRGVEFKAGSKTLFFGDHMHIRYQTGNSEDVIVFREDGNPVIKRLLPKMVFAGHTNQCSIENCLVDIPAEEQKRFRAIFNKSLVGNVEPSRV